MPEEPTPVYTEKTVANRKLVECEYGGHTGAARVFSAGLADAQERALAQAKDKHARALEE